MRHEEWQRIEALFYSAADLPPNRRGEFLREACGGDAALRQHVEELIAAENEASGFLAGALRETAAGMIGARTGDMLGPYRIVGELGHGGMGDVYLAERDDDQFRMQVAIKLIRSGAAPPRLLARFRAERQILASLEHPNIARLLDGGTAESSPFLVMEYVPGEPIDIYCRKQALSIRDRLRLFRTVCEAVAYAHRHLVIHRDIKPSNILVTAEGIPKLLDFGIAKLMKAEEPGDGLTRPLERVMTPAYASPEIVRGERVTTAADVYSLGALLYELLTGRAPFHLTGSQASEVERVVCQQEPPKPGAIDRRLRGDLENIVAMAMHKEPARRYGSVEQLIADVDRYLTGYPVAARSNRLYRWGKFARRNRGALAAAMLAAAGIAGWLVSLRMEQARTQRSFAQVRELAESLLFETDDELRPLAGATAAREAIVKRGLRYLDGLARETGANAALEDELSDAYERVADIQFSSGPNVGQPAGALDSCRKALAIRQELVRRDPSNVLLRRKLAMDYLRRSSLQQNLNDPAGALQSYSAASAILDQIARATPNDNAVRLELAGAYQREADRQFEAGNYAASRGLAERARELCRLSLAHNQSDRAAALRLAAADLCLLRNIGGVRHDIPSAQRAAALDLFRESEQLLTRLADTPSPDPGVHAALMSLYTHACALQHLVEDSSQVNYCRKRALMADKQAAADPADVSARITVVQTHHNLASRLWEYGEDKDGSLAEQRRAVEIADQLFAQMPESVAIRAMNAQEHHAFAAFLAEDRNPAAALAHERKAVQVRGPLLLDATADRERIEQCKGYSLIGDLESAQKSWRSATEAYRAAVREFAVLRGRHTLDPQGERDLEHARRRAAECELRQ